MAKTQVVGGAVLALLCSGCAPSNPAGGPTPMPELVGRTAGPPQSCVNHDSSTSVHFTNRNALVFTSGPTVWLNTTRCPALTDNDLPIFELSGSQYCRGDIVKTVDRYSGIPGPSCVLGDFIPYRRPPR
ncbi:MAG TPA: hypothetical protein VF067_06745 [Sphingomicrobium sp.]